MRIGKGMKRRCKITKGRVIAFILLILLSFIMLYPILMTVNLSFMTRKGYLNDPMQLVTAETFTTENYGVVFEKLKVFQRLFNSLWMTVIACVLSCLICSLAAFPIARGHLRCSNKIYGFIMLSMFFPGSLVATVVLMKNVLGLYGTPLAVVFLWGLSGLQISIFMIVGFVKQLPKELDEVAFLEGCGYFRYIVSIAIPLILPIISTVFTFKAVGCWNDFLTPMIYLNGDAFLPLTTGLYYFKGAYSSRWNELAAAIILVSIPMGVLYVFMQKYIIEGMTSGALKG